MRVLKMTALAAGGLAALSAVSATLLSAFGVLPWLSMQAGFGEAPAKDAGRKSGWLRI